MNYGRYAYDFLRLAYFVFYLHFLHKPKNSKLNLLYLVPFLSLKFVKYFVSLTSLISSTISQLSQIEKAVAFEISQFEFLHATKAFLLSILWILPVSTNLSNAR